MKQDNMGDDSIMKREYDFSTAERGRFYRAGAELLFPIYLDGKLQARIERIAQRKGEEIDKTVNRMLRNETKRLEGLE